MRSLVSFVRVDQVHPFGQRSAIDADEGQAADIRVGHDLERQGSKRSIVSRLQEECLRPCSRSCALMSPRSSGDGIQLTTASRSCWTPLFLKADPHRTGLNLFVQTPLRMTAWISSGVKESGFSKHFRHEVFIALHR